MLRRIVLAAAASATFGVIGSAAASGPTVAQVEAAIATHSDDFVLANAWADAGHGGGHGWIDVKAGAGRWVSANGKSVYVESVTPVLHHRALVIVADTNINYTTRTWSRTKREESANSARPRIVDPLSAASAGVQFRFLGVEYVDGHKTYHFRSTYYIDIGDVAARVDVWFSNDQDYLIRITVTTRKGNVVQRVDNHWLSRTSANLALTTTAIPSGFKQVSVSPRPAVA